MNNPALLDAATNTPEAGRIALKFFFGVTGKWGCSATQQRVLLGSVGKTTLSKYRDLPQVRLPHDTLERISYLMGIHKALRILFSNKADAAYEWMTKPNKAAPFNGKSALQYMLSGRMADLVDVRRYLDAARGW